MSGGQEHGKKSLGLKKKIKGYDKRILNYQPEPMTKLTIQSYSPMKQCLLHLQKEGLPSSYAFSLLRAVQSSISRQMLNKLKKEFCRKSKCKFIDIKELPLPQTETSISPYSDHPLLVLKFVVKSN